MHRDIMSYSHSKIVMNRMNNLVGGQVVMRTKPRRHINNSVLKLTFLSQFFLRLSVPTGASTKGPMEDLEDAQIPKTTMSPF